MDGRYGHPGRSDGASLAVRLMNVAGEYELERKAERARLEERAASAEARAASAERLLADAQESSNALQKRVQMLQADLESASSGAGTRLRGLQRALLASRFALADAAQGVLELEEGLAAAAGGSALGVLEPNVLARLAPTADKLAASRAAVAATSRWSSSALSAYAAAGDERAVEALLLPTEGKENASVAPPPVVASALGTALSAAVLAGSVRMVRLLLESGADAGSRSLDDGMLHSLLHVAAGAGQEGSLKLLLGKENASAGLGVDDRDAYGRTPLHHAAAGNHAAACKMLLMAGADPALKDVHGHTAAEVAAGGAEGWAYESGELRPNGAALAAAAILSDRGLSFWAASVRANRCYNERRFEAAIDAYGAALAAIAGGALGTSGRDVATLHYNRARARYRIGLHVAAVEDCSAALAVDSDYRNALAQRAECGMSLFDFERAARDFAGLIEGDPSDRQWARRLAEARALRDMSHYGVLGLPQDAEAGSIKRAYRGLVLKWHPDKVDASAVEAAHGASGGGMQEAGLRANTLFRRLTDAYGTLSDSYKRMLYDMDPRSGVGTPVAGGEGLERWVTRERSRDEERQREREAGADLRSAQATAEGELAAGARALRRKLVSLVGAPVSKTVPATAPLIASAPRTAFAPAIPPPLPPPSASSEELHAAASATATRARAAVAQAEAFVRHVQQAATAAGAGAGNISRRSSESVEEDKAAMRARVEARARAQADAAVPPPAPSPDVEEEVPLGECPVCFGIGLECTCGLEEGGSYDDEYDDLLATLDSASASGMADMSAEDIQRLIDRLKVGEASLGLRPGPPPPAL
jgi:hypothetical protein